MKSVEPIRDKNRCHEGNLGNEIWCFFDRDQYSYRISDFDS